ncbi:uncharacterized protein LOC135490748 [Lineus longissimus]|uniref:uncharacterized protein LOC135490748 n=1 Tax=Lineus longissimus TaxID=88925 RepID=UPI002B4D814F
MSRTKLKQRVQEKLTTIQEHRDEIVQFLDGVVREANSVAQNLTSVSDKSKFQTKYRSTMQSLEEHLNTLFLIKASLPGEDGGSESSECDEDEDELPGDDLGRTGSRNNSLLSPTPDHDSLDRNSPDTGSKGSAQPSAKYSKESSGRKHGGQIDSDDPEVKSEDLTCKKAELNIKDEQYVREQPKKDIERCNEGAETRSTEPLPVGAMASEGEPQIPKEQYTRPETELPEPELDQAKVTTDLPNLTGPAFQTHSAVPETGQQFEPVVSDPSQYLATPASTVESSPESLAKPVEQRPSTPPSYQSNEEPLVLPPPFGTRRFRREKRNISGKEASINMIMDSLNIRRDALEAVNQVKEALSAGKGGSIAASDISQASASSGLGPRTQKMSRSCVSLKSTGNASATSSFNPDYGLGPNIPSLTFQDGDEVNVVLLEVVTPSMFWVRPAGAEPDSLLEAMSVYYGKILNKNGLGSEPKVGTVCAARFTQDDMWYRAKIVGVTPDQNVSIHECQSEIDQSSGPHISPVDRFVVEVMYIDYGNQEKISENRLWQLTPEFSQMPVQAFCCALARVLPLDEHKWMMASHMLYAYNTTTLTGILSTEPGCPVLLLDLKIPGADSTFSNYLVAHNVARPVSNSEIAKTFLGVDNVGGDPGPADFLEAVKSMSPKMNNSEASLVQSVSRGSSVPAFDVGESGAKGQSQPLNDLQKGAVKVQSSDSNNERSNTPSTDEWKNTQADGSLDNLLDEALAGEDDSREASHEMKLSGEEPKSPISEKLEELSKCASSPEGGLDEGAPDGWLTLSFGAPSEELKKRELQIPRNGYIQFMMSHINNPGDFYVHLVDQRTSEILDQLNKDLNHEYKGYMKSMMGRYFEDQYTPTVKSLCCACFTKDNTYYRASVLEIRKVIKGVRRAGTNRQRLRQPKEQEEKYEVRVLYFDFGNIEWVPGSKVYPLTHRFWNIPVQAVHCTLANVRPTGINGRWSESATSVFEMKTGFEKSFLGYVIEDGEVVTEPIPLAILDLTDETWINTLLVEKNFAVAHLVENGTGDEYEDADEVEKLKNWDPMEEDYLSERNSLMVDVDDASVALTGYKSENSQRPCKFYGKTKAGCVRGDRCLFAHVDPSDNGYRAGEKGEAYCLIDTDTIQVPDEDNWMPVAVSAIFNPGRFYVNFPCGTQSFLNREKDDEGYEGSSHLPSSHRETLEMMSESLNEHYCKIIRRDRQLMGLAPGEIIAAQFSEDTSWYRAKVLDADTDSRTVEVFYVDFGNSEWISEDRVRLMEPQFLHMPFQAIECFLSNVEPIDGLAWSKESRDYFQKLVDGKRLFAHVISKNLNGVLRLDLYDTENEEDIYINKHLVQSGYARNVDPTATESPGSTDSGRPRSRMSSRSSVSGGKKRYSGSDVIEVYMPG